jgi:hypothetical protein
MKIKSSRKRKEWSIDLLALQLPALWLTARQPVSQFVHP